LIFLQIGIKERREREKAEIFSPFCLTAAEIMSVRQKKMCGASTFKKPSKVDCDSRDKGQGHKALFDLALVLHTKVMLCTVRHMHL